MEEENQEQVFWDEFAEEYTSIQAESQIPIQKDLKEFFKRQNIFPAKTFLDLAGGSGKYIPAFITEVENYYLMDFSKEMLRIVNQNYSFNQLVTIEKTQSLFLKEVADNSYEVVFTAMNPALNSKEQLNQLLRITAKYLCVLRMIEEDDSIFTPIEKIIGEFQQDFLMSSYKKWLEVPYRSVRFSYELEESVSKEFFTEYFATDFSKEELSQLVAKVFKEFEVITNRQTIVFELLLIEI